MSRSDFKVAANPELNTVFTQIIGVIKKDNLIANHVKNAGKYPASAFCLAKLPEKSAEDYLRNLCDYLIYQVGYDKAPIILKLMLNQLERYFANNQKDFLHPHNVHLLVITSFRTLLKIHGNFYHNAIWYPIPEPVRKEERDDRIFLSLFGLCFAKDFSCKDYLDDLERCFFQSETNNLVRVIADYLIKKIINVNPVEIAKRLNEIVEHFKLRISPLNMQSLLINLAIMTDICIELGYGHEQLGSPIAYIEFFFATLLKANNRIIDFPFQYVTDIAQRQAEIVNIRKQLHRLITTQQLGLNGQNQLQEKQSAIAHLEKTIIKLQDEIAEIRGVLEMDLLARTKILIDESSDSEEQIKYRRLFLPNALIYQVREMIRSPLIGKSALFQLSSRTPSLKMEIDSFQSPKRKLELDEKGNTVSAAAPKSDEPASKKRKDEKSSPVDVNATASATVAAAAAGDNKSEAKPLSPNLVNIQHLTMERLKSQTQKPAVGKNANAGSPVKPSPVSAALWGAIFAACNSAENANAQPKAADAKISQSEMTRREYDAEDAEMVALAMAADAMGAKFMPKSSAGGQFAPDLPSMEEDAMCDIGESSAAVPKI